LTLDMKKHGEGALYFCSGTKYIGSFQNGNIQGKRTLYQDDVVLHRGVW